jgi:hypothetical protein
MTWGGLAEGSGRRETGKGVKATLGARASPTRAWS